MRHLIAAIIAMLVCSLILIILACIAAIRNASEVMEREEEDLAQEAYIREWAKAHGQKEKPV